MRSWHLQLGEQLMSSLRRDDDAARGGRDESLVHSLVDEGEQGVVVPINVQQTHLPIPLRVRRNSRERSMSST